MSNSAPQVITLRQFESDEAGKADNILVAPVGALAPTPTNYREEG